MGDRQKPSKWFGCTVWLCLVVGVGSMVLYVVYRLFLDGR